MDGFVSGAQGSANAVDGSAAGVGQSVSVAFSLSKAGSLGDVVPQTVVQNAASALRGAPDGTTLVLRADDAGVLESFVVFPAQRGVQFSNVAFQIAQTVAARSVQVEVPDLSSAGFVAQMMVSRLAPVAGAATQAGVEFGNTIQILAGLLQRNEWAAVVLRSPSRVESRRHARWRQSGLKQLTHHSLMAGMKVASVYAGSFDADRARAIALSVPGAMPGFDLQVDAVPVRLRNRLWPWLLWALLFVAAGVGLSWLSGQLPVFVPGLPWWLFGVFGAVVCVGLGVARLLGVVGSAQRRFVRCLSAGLLPLPRVLRSRPRPPRKEQVQVVRQADGSSVQRVVPESAGDYPLHVSTAMVGAALPLSVVAPHADHRFGSRGAAERRAPAALRRPVGPLLARDAEGDVFLSAADAWAGVFVSGQAGSGKSYLLEALWGWHCWQLSLPVSQRVLGLPERTMMVAFDTKEDGAASAAYSQWAARFQVPLYRFDVADRSAGLVGIDLFLPPDPERGRSCVDWAVDVVDALVYAYGESAVGHRSQASLVSVFSAAMLLSLRSEIVSAAPGVDVGRSPFYYANILIGNRDDQLASDLAAAVANAATLDGVGREVRDVAERLEPLYGPSTTASFRRGLFDAPRSKVSPLLELDHWWSRPQRLTWDALLEEGYPVIVNVGVAPDGSRLSDSARTQIGSLILYAYYSAVKRACIGWQAQGRRAVPLADEVKHLAEHSSEVLSWLRNDGRAFGQAPMFATQFLEQLDQSLQRTMGGFGTQVWYAQNNERVIAQAVSALSVEGVSWSAQDISLLPRFTAIVKTTLNQTAMPAFVGEIPAFGQMSNDEFVARCSGGVEGSVGDGGGVSALGLAFQAQLSHEGLRERMRRAADAADVVDREG